MDGKMKSRPADLYVNKKVEDFRRLLGVANQQSVPTDFPVIDWGLRNRGVCSRSLYGGNRSTGGDFPHRLPG
jgi:hypothetical protein